MKTATLWALAGVACGALAAGLSGASGVTAKGDDAMLHAGSGPAALDRPALDRERPARTERAVFALG